MKKIAQEIFTDIRFQKVVADALQETTETMLVE
jgi:histone H3/H4